MYLPTCFPFLIWRSENKVVLIPKVDDPFHTGMYRPITLTNSDYKLVLRVWAGRLGAILGVAVEEHQKGFIPGRDGRENVLTVQYCMDKLAKKKVGGIVFLDLEKAFDRVSHEALHFLLEKFEFPEAFRTVVKAIYTESEITLMINEQTSESIKVHSGTKQGCPLSPLLFTIIGEVLSQMLKGSLEGVELPNMDKAVAAYADDTAIICASTQDLKRTGEILDKYEIATGMRKNTRKTEVVSLDPKMTEMASKMGFATPKEVKYLGCPVGINPDYDKLWERILGR